MRLKSIKIEGHPVFKEFVYDKFDLQTEPKDVATFLIGKNGSGKSIFFEIIVEIFQAIFNDRDLNFKYTLKYVLNDISVTLEDGTIYLTERKGSGDGLLADRKLLKRERADWLPKHVIFYYSGDTERARIYFSSDYERNRTKLLNGETTSLPHFFYISPDIVSLVLITLYVFNDAYKESKLWERVGLAELKYFRLKFNKVSWYESSFPFEDSNMDFWGARGSVAEFLDKMKAATTSTKTAEVEFKFKDQIEKYRFYQDLLIDGRDMKVLRDQFDSPKKFFKSLLDLNMSGLIQNIEIVISKKNSDSFFGFEMLSEGEKQLLLVLGFLELTKDDNVLFMFDEPDTHLNPLWKYEYFKSIMEIVGDSSKSVQILISTHDPLIISGLEKENVIVVANDSGNIEMEPASDDLFGKGVDAILTSELFGLNSTIDEKTLEKMIERRKLLVKKENKTISSEEIETLDKLNTTLEGIDINTPFADPLYKDFVMAIGNLDVYKDLYISETEKAEREEIAKAIMKRLMKNQE